MQQGMQGITEPYSLEFCFNEGGFHFVNICWTCCSNMIKKEQWDFPAV